jgi:Cu(I)/Ag(I) efflux system membrane fusion protein
MRSLLLASVASVMVAAGVNAAPLPSALVDSYLQVQAALANDKFDGIAVHAKALQTSAGTLGADAAKIVSASKQLEAAKDIAAARKAFGEVSDAVVAYAEKTKADLGDLKVAYCPMVNKPWLQKDKDIKNPYYGAAMLTCGAFRTKN